MELSCGLPDRVNKLADAVLSHGWSIEGKVRAYHFQDGSMGAKKQYVEAKHLGADVT